MKISHSVQKLYLYYKRTEKYNLQNVKSEKIQERKEH
jgi:hypothetical protein